MGCNWSCCNFCTSETSGESNSKLSLSNINEAYQYIKKNMYIAFIIIGLLQILAGIYVYSFDPKYKFIVACLIISGICHSLISGLLSEINEKKKKITRILYIIFTIMIIIFNSFALNDLLISSNNGHIELWDILLIEAICITLWISGISFGATKLYIKYNKQTNVELDDVLLYK
jgi:hypothetical protein